MISEDVIKTVIGIVPGWEIRSYPEIDGAEDTVETEDGYWGDVSKVLKGHVILDALAAAAVRVVNQIPDHYVLTDDTIAIVKKTIPLKSDSDITWAESHDETENRLNAIAELVERQPELFK